MQFRTKARAVDLLGKGQIADLPTAITELWKNGYDAYADNLTAEIYLDTYKDLKTPLFVMTDDGKGMSKADIFEKWLVLGTDSKSRAKLEDKESLETLWKKPRIKSGEKGIGRLSVAFLGSPMLMLTKKIGHPLQALFFDWRLLENYNLFLDDVNIPVEEINNIQEFNTVFEKLRNGFLSNFKNENDVNGNLIWEESQDKLKNEIESAVQTIQVPSFFHDEIIFNIIDIENHHGTKFIIFDPIDQIIDLTINDEDNIDDKDFVLKSLSGFTNEFKKDNKIIQTSIPIHQEIGFDYDYLDSSGKFYSYEDFKLGDVLVNGEFDGKGGFAGKIRIYDEIIDYTYTSPRKHDSRNYYGSCPIKLGYSLGERKSTFLEKDRYDYIKSKLKKKGGALFIYRDNFRVLPYGRTDFDFLEFEKRRALKAGDHFWSHQRMFGYIELSRDINPKLRDKSSREGLINNGAYRAFKNDLIFFFKRTANDFFATNPKESIYRDKQKELNEQSAAIKKDKSRSAAAKREFTNALKAYPDKFDKYQEEYKLLIHQLDEKTKVSNVLYSEIESILDRLQTLEIDYKDLIPKISKRYKPTDTQLDRMYKYEDKLIVFNDTIRKDSVGLMIRVKEKLEIKELKIDFSKNYQKYIGKLQGIIGSDRSHLKERFDFLLKDYNGRAKRIEEDLSKDKDDIINSIISKEQVIIESEKINAKFENLREQISKELTPLVEHINRVSFDINEEIVQGAYKAEYESFKYQWEKTRDAAQLGIAVEIIDHEFNQLYAKINNSIKKLSKENLFTDIEQFNFLSSNFKQLEDKYDLLSPLYRISGVVKKEIKCSSIFSYLKKFFESKIISRQIDFVQTKEFQNHTLIIKEPIIHTVFINIVNNAMYWLRNSKVKQIDFDYIKETDEIIIRNSGEKIEEHRIEKIFELFYSNRPNGRGIGLYLSKQSLNESYLDIYATNNKKYNILKGACFVIKPLK